MIILIYPLHLCKKYGRYDVREIHFASSPDRFQRYQPQPGYGAKKIPCLGNAP